MTMVTASGGAMLRKSPRFRPILVSSLLGAGVFFALFLYSLLGHGGFSIMGVEDDRLDMVLNILQQDLPLPISHHILWLLALHLLAGLFLGLWAGLLAKKPSRQLAVIFLLHGLFYIRQMVRTPQLYADLWVAQGGIRAVIQCALTDHLAPIFPEAGLGILAAIALWRFFARSKLRLAVGGTLGLAVFFLVSLAGSKAPLSPSAQDAGRPNIILIIVDSLRPDRLSANGYHRDTTPNIDALIRQGALFNRCYTQLPRTFPSLVSLFTGVAPHRNGLRTMFPTYETRAFLPPSITQLLVEAGYRTRVVTDFAGDIFPRVDLGFQKVTAPDFNLLTLAQLRMTEMMTNLLPYANNRTGRVLLPILNEFAHNPDPEILTDMAIASLRQRSGGPPFFLTLFYSNTHYPFTAPYPHYKRYTKPDYKGPHRYHKFTIAGRSDDLEERAKRQVSDLYDGALRAVDEQIGRLSAALAASGLWRNTVLILTGDHGEDLYETPNTPVEHGAQLRTEYGLKVPLLLLGPGIPKDRRYSNRVRLIDIAPTIADLAGLETTPFEGKSLAAILDGGETGDRVVTIETGLWYDTQGDGFYQDLRLPYPDVTKILEVDRGFRFEIVLRRRWEELTNFAKHRALIEDGMKLIRMPLLDGPRYELYDLDEDPMCRRDLAASRPEVVARMAARLDRAFAEGER